MANVEQNRNAGERMGDFLKRFGLVGAVIGAIGIMAEMKIGGTLFIASAGVAAGGVALEKLSGSSKKR